VFYSEIFIIKKDVAVFHNLKDHIGDLSDTDKIIIYTIYWTGLNIPDISNSSNLIPNDAVLTGHTMIFAAYDPSHKNSAGNIVPYGFINSWGAHDLSWMSEQDISTKTSAIVVMSKK